MLVAYASVSLFLYFFGADEARWTACDRGDQAL